MYRPNRREEAIAHHHMVTAMALADTKALDLQAAEMQERQRIKGNELMDVAFNRQERTEMRAAEADWRSTLYRTNHPPTQQGAAS
ncbi:MULTISPECIES: hypothetical protein [unclassified Nocardioides]|uniref:hypothetical protein n=1 Tax=unclassified Nocardioides TaxID=2615069 RepID=UPI003014719F